MYRPTSVSPLMLIRPTNGAYTQIYLKEDCVTGHGVKLGHVHNIWPLSVNEVLQQFHSV